MGTAPRPILTHFHGFAIEGEIVGRLLTGYANLEVGLLHCVQMVLGDFETPLKAMFRVRSERWRIEEDIRLGYVTRDGAARDYGYLRQAAE